MMQKTAS